MQRVQLGALDALCSLLEARPEGSLCERLIAFLVRRANDTSDDAVRSLALPSLESYPYESIKS